MANKKPPILTKAREEKIKREAKDLAIKMAYVFFTTSLIEIMPDITEDQICAVFRRAEQLNDFSNQDFLSIKDAIEVLKKNGIEVDFT